MLSLDDVTPPRRPGGPARAISFVRPYLFGAGSALYVFLFGWIKPRNRALIVELSRHFGYSYNVREKPQLPVVSANEVTDENHPIEIRALESVDGNVTDRELITICRLVRAAQPQTIFEIGTFDGRTTLNLAANSPESALVYTLDLPPGESGRSEVQLDAREARYANKSDSGARFRNTTFDRKIVQLFGDSASFEFSPYGNSIDFVFVDASHVYEYVINDSLQALRMLRNGRGTIVWHDYSHWDGVTRALNDLRAREPDCGGIQWIEGTSLALLRR